MQMTMTPSSQVPYTDLRGQLAWTRSGRVWAGWRITNPLAYTQQPIKDKERVADTHRALWQSLGGEAVIQGLVTNIAPETTVRRMLARHAPEAWHKYSDAIAEAEATLDQLQDMALGERSFWLWVPLRNLGRDLAGVPARAALRNLKDKAAMPVADLSVEEIAARQQQADELAGLIPHVFAPRPVTPAERMWVWAHACTRGLWSTPPEIVDGQDERVHSGCAITEPIIDVGGRTDLEGSRVGMVNPLSRRFVKVIDPAAEDLGYPASYQSMLAVRDLPIQGMAFPGSEYLGLIDNFGVMADWTVRLQVNARDKVLKETQRAVRQLNDQYQQQESADSGQHALDLSSGMLHAYQEIFTNNPDELEIKHTTILTVAGGSSDECQSAARQLTAAMKGLNIKLDRPLGRDQDGLWWGATPDTPTNKVTRRYTQRTTASDFALSVPFISTRVGDNRGWLAGFNRSVPTMTAAIHLALMDAPLNGGSSSLGCGGELGSGKTYFLKSLAGYTVDDGGQVVTIDNTSEGEWGHFAGSVTDSLVVECQDPATSMDLLRILGLERGTGPMLAFLTALLQVGVNSDKGIVLASVLTPTYLEDHGLESIAAVMRHLIAGECDLEGISRESTIAVGNHMRTHAARPYARVIFDDSLPAVSLQAPFIVFRTNGLKLPDREELANAHRFEQMAPDRLFGRAYYALLAHAVYEISNADRSRFTLFPVDEAAGLTLSPEGEAVVIRFIREGRRGNQAAALGSQNPADDFGSETLKELLVYRVMMRMTSTKLAEANLEWLGLDPQDPSFRADVERLTKATSPKDENGKVPPHRRGEGILRDTTPKIGWWQVRQPGNAERRAALESDPPVAADVVMS